MDRVPCQTNADYTYRGSTTRAQPFTCRADGTPDFGKRLSLTNVLQELSNQPHPAKH